MAKKNYWYAVELINGTSSIVNDWDKCQSIIKTCPSNARYKKFSSREDAEKFLGKKISEETKKDNEIFTSNTQTAVAYVDGSYNSDIKTWGYGVVLFPVGQEDKTKEYMGNGTSYYTARNVAGEIFGAVQAAKAAVSMGFDAIEIYHDYQGIASWAEGSWAAKQELTQKYKQIMDELSKKIKISFRKVAAHTGVSYNERADYLAKKAAGIK